MSARDGSAAKAAIVDEPRTYPNLRPRDAATLIVLRRDDDALRVLMGRRSRAHVFMPGAMVFPGGRVDRCDRHAPAADDLHPGVATKLAAATRNADPLRHRAIALAAIRETFEETGILIGRASAETPKIRAAAWAAFLAHGVVPTLSSLRLVARAVTPPRHSRRFDARFFAVFADAVAARVPVPDDELEEPAWLTFEEARAHPLVSITRRVLDDLAERLERDPQLSPDATVPFHCRRHGAMITDAL